MRQAGKGGRKNKFLVTAMEFVCSSQAVECHPCPRSLHPDT